MFISHTWAVWSEGSLSLWPKVPWPLFQVVKLLVTCIEWVCMVLIPMDSVRRTDFCCIKLKCCWKCGKCTKNSNTVVNYDVFLFQGTASVLPSEVEQQSLAGSTAGLIRNEYRHSNTSFRKQQDTDNNSLHLTDLTKRPDSSRPVISASGADSGAPIISLPIQVFFSLTRISC